MKRILTLALVYTLFAVLLTVGLAIWKFPYDTLNAWLRNTVNTSTPVTLSIAELGPAYFPPGLTLKDVAVSSKGKEVRTLLAIPEAKAALSLVALATTHLAADVSAQAYGGTINASVATGAAFDTDARRLKLTAEKIDLSKHEALAPLLNIKKLTGLANLEMTVDSARKDGKDLVQATGNLTIDNLIASTPNPFFRGGLLNLGKVTASFAPGPNGRVEIPSLKIDSKTIKADLTGFLKPATSLANTYLELTGEWRVDPTAIDMTKVQGFVRDLLMQRKPFPLTIKGRPGNFQLAPG